MKKVAFITGGNTGLGLASAKRFAREGVDVVIVGRRADRNAQAATSIEALGVRCLALTGDVSDEAFVAAAVEQTVEQFGGLHYAFNNAGVEQAIGPIANSTADEYTRVMDANVKGVWLCMKYQLPKMVASGGGSIVNTSSIFGTLGAGYNQFYVASKHAVIGLTKSAALEYAAQSVRVNAICPGAIRTELYDRLIGDNPELDAAVVNSYPTKFLGNDDDVASAVWWLCEGAGWVTGQSLAIDGGLTIQ